MSRRRKDNLSAQIAAIRDLQDAPDDAALRATLRTALRKRASPIAARAAALIQRRRLDGFIDDLLFAFDRFLKDPVKRDPSCAAKRAILEALDQLDHDDPALFARAARVVQLEPAWGPPVDTAVPVRSRAALALGRIYFPDAALYLSALICDPAPAVQRAAIEAIRHRGDRSGAGLLWMRIQWQPEEPELLVQSEAMVAFVQLAPDYAVPLLATALEAREPEDRELVAYALAESRAPQALQALMAWWERTVLSNERQVIIDVIAAHRTEPAHRFLRELVADGSTHDARSAIRALARQAFTEDAREQLLLAAREHPDDLTDFARLALEEAEVS